MSAKPATEMTIVACPDGGYAVYTPEHEERAFIQGRAMRPVSAFSDLDEALHFVLDSMTPQEAKAHGIDSRIGSMG